MTMANENPIEVYVCGRCGAPMGLADNECKYCKAVVAFKSNTKASLYLTESKRILAVALAAMEKIEAAGLEARMRGSERLRSINGHLVTKRKVKETKKHWLGADETVEREIVDDDEVVTIDVWNDRRELSVESKSHKYNDLARELRTIIAAMPINCTAEYEIDYPEISTAYYRSGNFYLTTAQVKAILKAHESKEAPA